MKKKTTSGWRFKGNEIRYLREVLNTDFKAKLSASKNEKLEKLFAKKHKQKFAITANSGTSTLHMALNAFGVGHGDEVIIPNLTVAMCGFAVWSCGAVPVYADVDKKTFLIDPKDIEKKITKKTKAIMVVHLYGLMCDMKKIMKIARKHKLFVLEDCAQCFFGKNENNEIAGTIGHVGSWSFETTKHITTGDGGIVTTDNVKLGVNMRRFGSAGYKNLKANTGKIRIDKSKFQNPNWGRHDRFAYNYRLSEICAAVGLAQLERIDYFLKKRKLMSKLFTDFFKSNNSKLLIPQHVPKGYVHSYFTFPVLFNGDKHGITWRFFRKKFTDFGGDGIYASWKTVSNEGPFFISRTKGLRSGQMKISNSYGYGETPVADEIQKKIMQFTTNQKNITEMRKQIKCLEKTLRYFNQL